MTPTCKTEACERPVEARQLCSLHYRELLGLSASQCSIEDCDAPARARGWCRIHYQRWSRHGDPQGVAGPRAPSPHGALARYRSGCRCHDCKAKKREVAADYVSRNPDAVKRYQDKYQAENKAALAAKSKQRYQENRDEIRAAARERYALDPEQYRQAQRAYREANAELVRAWRRAYYNTESGRAASRAGALARRAALLGADHGCVTAAFLADLLRDAECIYCGAPAEHRDHVHPLSKGGLHCVENLVPACAPCNLSKSDRVLDTPPPALFKCHLGATASRTPEKKEYIR